ncbi:MAG: IS1 family transposase [Planctomycetes bacterium]|nr:IS1 family transposase [Planctomycetota bacterium]
MHAAPKPGFYFRRGSYWPKCRAAPISRYHCKSCGRSFSRQTFRHDYRDHRPEINEQLFLLLTSGVGLRQCSRLLSTGVRCPQQKLVKMGRTLAWLRNNLCPSLPGGRVFLMDEEETYEGASIRPLTMPVVIDRQTWFVVDVDVGPIRRLARRGTRRRALQDEDEAENGRRPDRSRQCVERVLCTLAAKCPEGPVLLQTDKKSSYPTLARRLLGDRVTHEVTSSKRARDRRNPLFPINVTLAMTRDNCGRLRRKSWLVTKLASRLFHHVQLFAVYRNFVRRRFNRDEESETPARLLGLVPRNLAAGEVLAWRQDWGESSIHPMSSKGAHTVRDRMPA